MEGIVKELLTDTYYFNRMSMFLRESYGIKERIEVLAKIIKRLDEVYEKIIGELNVFDIFDEDYSTNYEIDESKTNQYLDRVGNIFGLKRSFTIKMIISHVFMHSSSVPKISRITMHTKCIISFIFK